MAATKYAQIKKQIEKLQLEAESMRKAAIKGVVDQIKAMMEEHGISVAELRGTRRGRPGRKPGRKPGRPAKAVKAAKKPAQAAKATKPAKAAKNTKAKAPKAKPARAARAKAKAKFRSPEDRKVTWTGRGRTPNWVKAWVDGGKKLDELLIR